MANQQFTPQEIKNEEWRDIPGYEGLYQVSNLGNVFSIRLKTRNGVGVLTPLITPNGYHHVNLCNDGEDRRASVHRLVAAAFIGECPPGLVVNHRNGVKTDNHAVNLEYCTQKENDNHSRYYLGNLKRGEENGSAKLTEEQVKQIRLRYATGMFSQPDLARQYGVDQATIWRIIHRKTWKHI